MTEPFVKIPTRILRNKEISSGDKVVYALIRSYGRWGTGENAFPSEESIAFWMKCSSRTVARSIRVLKDKGFLTSSRRLGKSNLYSFTQDTGVQGGRTSVSVSLDISRHEVGTPVSAYQEPGNEKKISTSQLRYCNKGASGFSVCEIIDRIIYFKAFNGSPRERYGDENDAFFRYGNLRGVEAKNAALSDHVAKLGGEGKMDVPTDGSPSSETCPLTTKYE